MKKRWIAGLFAGAMVISAFTACGNAGSSTGRSKGESAGR